MKVEVEGLPDWIFDIREVSVSVYNVRAVHSSGASVDLTDAADPELLLERAKESALSMQEALKRLRK
jgi:hypothetical protein